VAKGNKDAGKKDKRVRSKRVQVTIRIHFNKCLKFSDGLKTPKEFTF